MPPILNKGYNKMFQTCDDAAWGNLEVKVDEGVHQWRAWSGLILEQSCQTGYEVLHPEEPSEAELAGQHQQSYQNICVVDLPVEVEDAVSVESQGLDW